MRYELTDYDPLLIDGHQAVPAEQAARRSARE